MAAESKQASPVSEETPERMTGTVKWFSSMKGYGFITADNGDGDLFVHQTSIHADGFRSLRIGELVEYSVEIGEDDRARASNVTGPKGGFVEGAGASSEGDFYVGDGGRNSNGGGRGRGGRGRGRGRGAPSGSAGGFGGGRGGAACYNCGQPGHFARDCTGESVGRGGGGGGRGGACYSCGEPGHLARDCDRQ